MIRSVVVVYNVVAVRADVDAVVVYVVNVAAATVIFVIDAVFDDVGTVSADVDGVVVDVAATVIS